MRVLAVLCLLIGLAAGARAEGVRVARGYHKGRPIKLRLVTIDWTEVEVETARAFLRMREAAARAGVSLHIRSGFRDHQRQMWLYQAWRAGFGNRAARPGYSNHESGRALDIVVHDPATFAWLTANAKYFGFRRTVKSEPWHWEFRRGWVPRKRGKTKPAVRSVRARS